MLKRHLGVSVVVLSVLLLVPFVAGAQSIGGTVSDNTGGVLPGVTVEARSPALIEQVRTVVTDGAGQFLVVGLESGVYTVTFTLPGFSTVLREGIELQTGFTANVDAQLQVGSVAETITVSGASPIVDVQSVNEQAVMNREIIDAVPTGKSFQNLGILIPGMIAGGVTGSAITQDVGGTAGQNYMTLAIHGGDGSDQSVQIDGMAVETMIREDTSLLAASDGNYSEFALDYSASAADVETGGVRVNMIPRAGGNNFAGEVFTSFSGEALQSDNIDDDLIARRPQRAQPGQGAVDVQPHSRRPDPPGPALVLLVVHPIPHRPVRGRDVRGRRPQRVRLRARPGPASRRRPGGPRHLAASDVASHLAGQDSHST